MRPWGDFQQHAFFNGVGPVKQQTQHLRVADLHAGKKPQMSAVDAEHRQFELRGMFGNVHDGAVAADRHNEIRSITDRSRQILGRLQRMLCDLRTERPQHIANAPHLGERCLRFLIVHHCDPHCAFTCLF